jgi:hypothetical protein
MDSQVTLYSLLVVAIAMLGLGLVIGKLTFGKSSKKEHEQALLDAEKTIGDAKILAETLKRTRYLKQKRKYLSSIQLLKGIPFRNLK